jgi:hypothetical protein
VLANLCMHPTTCSHSAEWEAVRCGSRELFRRVVEEARMRVPPRTFFEGHQGWHITIVNRGGGQRISTVKVMYSVC